jgi:hypothetical protein
MEITMFRKSLRTSILLALILILAACSTPSITGLSKIFSTASQSQSSDISKLTLQNKLGIGILNLENTNLALTTDQATTLLPLWKAVKTLSSDKTVTDSEISALYAQIQEDLTTEQLQAIEKTTWTTADLTTLKAKYGVQAVQSGQTGNQTSSQTTQTQTQNSAGMDPGGGMPPGGDPLLAGGDIQGQTTATQVSTTVKTVQTSTSSGNLYNLLFADTLITQLQQYASAE